MTESHQLRWLFSILLTVLDPLPSHCPGEPWASQTFPRRAPTLRVRAAEVIE
jgi:hypothetical protein